MGSQPTIMSQLQVATLLWMIMFSTQSIVNSLISEVVNPFSVHYPCNPKDPKTTSYRFCNTTLPISERTHDIVRRLSLKEKIGQLSTTARSIDRLGIPSYEWWSEALHGLAPDGPGVLFNGTITASTTFPQVILTASSFNETLWGALADAIAIEALAMGNVGQAGMTFWAPNINIFRDPRWGRGQETPGEDPLVVSRYAVAYVRAFQEAQEHDGDSNGGGELSRIRLSACCKHFTAYDLELWNGSSRYTFNAVVTEQDLEDSFQPPFRSCIEEGHASCLMCSYNQVNGVPACAHEDLLSQKARVEWGFKGYIPSDCDAVAIIHENQKYVDTPEDAVAAVLKAGMDINCGTYLLRYTLSAVEKGKLEESTIDHALINLFTVQMRLGLFDGDLRNKKYANLGPQDVCTHKHRQLALEAARQGIVLLVNKENTLPLFKSHISSLAIIGPNADAPIISMGSYSGTPCKVVTPLEGLRSHVQKVIYSTGCDFVNCTTKAGFTEAKQSAATVDGIVIVVGLDPTQEREDHDRTDLILPGYQQNLVSEVASVSKGPVVLVIMSGGPIDISFAVRDPHVSAILWVGYPGEAGGQALAEIIFGEYNPGGKLPMTWYPQEFVKVPMNNMNMRPDPSTGYPGRTYRFYTGDVVFPFGHGISYSKFIHKMVSTTDKIQIYSSSKKVYSIAEMNGNVSHIPIEELKKTCDRTKFSIKVIVHNHGPKDGDHVVLLYVKTPADQQGAPKKQLISFGRIHVRSGAFSSVVFPIQPCTHMNTVTTEGARILSSGTYTFMTEEAEFSLFLSIDLRLGKTNYTFRKS